jgi:hypothetical protein
MWHHQEACVCLLSYVSRQGIIHKILRYSTVCIMLRPGVHLSAQLYAPGNITLEFYQLYPVLIRNSEDAYVLPDDGSYRPEHVEKLMDEK